jgi:NYN domain
MAAEPASRVLRTALFLDFDNIYIRLKESDENAAKTFAEHPGEWLEWLSILESRDGPVRRRFLALACYLNPATDDGARPFFASTGFRVVDCPALTVRGKSASDIHLVLDAVDALAIRLTMTSSWFCRQTPTLPRCCGASARTTAARSWSPAGRLRQPTGPFATITLTPRR